MLRLSHALALVWLVSISLLGIISGFNLGAPFDQRTGQHVPGAKLAMSAWSGVIEPILAPFFVIAGAPDYKYAAISTMGWLFAGATIVHIAMHWSELRRRYVLLLNGVLFGIGCVLLFSLYLSVAVLIPLPSWSLAVDDPVVIVADLHSHSIPSHDAIVTPAQSRAIHRDRGFNVIGRTEHYTEKWRFALSATPRTLDESVEVIPGVEIGVVTGGKTALFPVARDWTFRSVGKLVAAPYQPSSFARIHRNDPRCRAWRRDRGFRECERGRRLSIDRRRRGRV